MNRHIAVMSADLRLSKSQSIPSSRHHQSKLCKAVGYEQLSRSRAGGPPGATTESDRIARSGDFVEDDGGDGEYMDMGEEEEFFKAGEDETIPGSKKRKGVADKGEHSRQVLLCAARQLPHV